jgi:hypothetical protein
MREIRGRGGFAVTERKNLIDRAGGLGNARRRWPGNAERYFEGKRGVWQLPRAAAAYSIGGRRMIHNNSRPNASRFLGV